MTSNGELSFQLYKWLSALQIITTGQKYKPNGNIQLDSKNYQELISGQLMGKLVETLAKELNIQLNGPLLSSIKKSNTPASRVYNWNVLSESFAKIGIVLSKQTQKQITSGNFEQLKRFLLEIQRKMIPKKIQRPTPQKQQPPEQMDFSKIQKYNSYNECEDVIEVIIKMISKTCGLTVKQAFSTLGENLKYFSHMIVKGIKNSYDQIVAFFKTMIQTMPHLLYLAEKDPAKNTTFLLQLIKPSLISREPEVALFGSNALCSLIYESMKYNDKNLVYQILSGQQAGFDFIYMGIKRHPHLVPQYFQFIHPLVQNSYKQFYEVHLKNIINNHSEYIKTIIILLEGLRSHQQATKSVIECGLVKNWVKMCEQEFNLSPTRKQLTSMPNPQPDQDAKILSLELMCDLWKLFSTVLDQKQAEDLLMRGIQELKRNTRKDNYLTKVSALNRLFDFLDYLASQKNRLAAIVYKKTIFLLFENHEDLQLRQVILQNFMLTFKKFPTIPPQFLLAPLLRQLMKQEGQTYVLNIFDFEFFVELFKHPKVEADWALNYLQYFTKLYTKNIIYSGVVIRIIEILCSRFCQQETIMEYIMKNAENNLNVYGMLAIGKKQYIKDRQERLMNSQKKSLVIELLKYYIKLQNEFITSSLKSKVLKLYVNWLDTKKHDDKGLYYLLTLFGDVQELVMMERIQRENSKFDQRLNALSGSRQKNQQNQSYADSHSNINQFSPFAQSHIIQMNPNNKSRGLQESNINIWRQDPYLDSNPFNNYESRQLKPKGQKKFSQKLIKTQVDPKTLQDIQIYRDKFRRQSLKKKQLLQKSISAQLIPKANQTQIIQRQISMGYNKIVKAQHLFYDFDTVKTKYLKQQTEMIELQELQDRDILSINTVLKRYQKQIQSLFYKYTNIGSLNNRAPTQEKVFISFTDLNRLLKDKNVNKLPKIVINQIITFINKKKKYNINVLVGVQEKEFNQFLILFTNLYLKEEKMDKDEPFGMKLEKILLRLFQGEWFARELNDRKANEWFEQNQISKLEKEDQQKLPVPEGYKKVFVQETIQQCVIPLAEEFNIPQSYSVCFSVLNQIFGQKFGIYVFPPVTEVKLLARIVVLNKAIKPKIKIPNVMTQKLIKKSIQTSSESNKIVSDKQKLTRKSKQQDDKNDMTIEFSANLNLNSTPSAKISLNTRSKSQKDGLKRTNKTQILNSEEIIKKKQQQQQYAKKLREELQVLKKQKQKKGQQQKQKKQIEQLQKLKKQEKKKKYLQENKKKIQQKKEKQQQQKRQQQAKQNQQKEKKKLQLKQKQRQLLQKMQKQIQDKKSKFDEKQKSKQKHLKKIQRIQKKAKNIVNQAQKQTDPQKQKQKRLLEQINNGKELISVVNNYQQQVKILFEEYWNWKTKKIELKQIALMMKNFKISPDYLSPKLIAETFKVHGKGEPLTIDQFKKLLIKFCYKSEKLKEQLKINSNKQFEPGLLKSFFQDKFCMKAPIYVEIIKKAKLQQL